MCCWNRNKQKSSAIGKKIENVAFIVTIVIVLGLFTLPIIFYYTSSYNRDTSNNASIYYKGFNSNITGISQNCTRLSWSQDNDASECHEYTGIACRNFLHQWFQCTIGEGELNIGVSQQEQNQHEQTITSLNSYLEIYKQCQQQSSAFICQYFFPLADCSTGKSYKATKEDCLLISTGVCLDLWALANNSGNGSLLPDCSTLPNEVVATSISLTFCIVAIIVAVKEYKTLLAYPSILVLFQVIDITVVGIVLITTAIYRYELYCSSVSLLETLNNPTPFCKFSGVVFHYTFANMALSWFFHVAIFFYKVLFPFQANRFEKLGRNKYIFATVTILSLLLPLPAIIICLTVDKFKYNIHRFPTTICTSSSGMMFYSITLLMDVLFATGVIMLIIVLWTMRNNTHFLNKRRGHTKLSTAEKKILLAF
uniref:FZ domain-containing protein n=1 Tax=Amphimedon queenslandica TaxID=400682 RepID=A0A1X7UEL9_AMPQE